MRRHIEGERERERNTRERDRAGNGEGLVSMGVMGGGTEVLFLE